MELQTTMNIRLTLTENILGSLPSDPEIYARFIGSKSPDALTLEDEVAAIGAAEMVDKGTTVFARDEEDCPCLYDYHIKGFFKSACSMLRKVPKSESGKIKAYKKEIDGLVFAFPRLIRINLPKGAELTTCQRPLRASTAQGERISLASSEEAPAGSTLEFAIGLFNPELEPAVTEWLDYGKYSGLGQWRNSGKGRFTWERLPD